MGYSLVGDTRIWTPSGWGLGKDPPPKLYVQVWGVGPVPAPHLTEALPPPLPSCTCRHRGRDGGHHGHCCRQHYYCWHWARD